jgi:hypothetical protein
MAFAQSVKDTAMKRAHGCRECTRSSCVYSGRCTMGGAEFNHKRSQRSGSSDGLANCEVPCAQYHKNTRSYGAH